MTTPAQDTPTAAPAAAPDPDRELAAIQTVLGALSGLQPDQRQRVVEYVFQRLGVKTAPPAPPGAPQSLSTPAAAGAPTPAIRDIRTLKEQKRPRTANEMAALVAYYLAELAPEGSRKAAIGSEDITTYFKQADFPLPAVLRNALPNAKAAGYFDNVAHGAYRLNPVGHNLVAHGLPAEGAEANAKRSKGQRKAGKKGKSGTGK